MCKCPSGCRALPCTCTAPASWTANRASPRSSDATGECPLGLLRYYTLPRTVHLGCEPPTADADHSTTRRHARCGSGGGAWHAPTLSQEGSDIQKNWSERVSPMSTFCLRRKSYPSRLRLIHDMQRHCCVSHCYIRRISLCFPLDSSECIG